MFGHWLNLKIPKTVVATMHNPAKVAYVYPAEIFFITWDKQYIHKTIDMALISEGKILVNPSASFANIFEAVPNTTAAIKKV